MIRPTKDLSFFIPMELVDDEKAKNYPSEKQRQKLLKRVNELLLSRIPAEDAIMFKDHWLDGIPISQIAKETGKSKHYIRAHIIKTAKIIRNIIESEPK